MDPIRFSIEKPVTVIVGIILLVMFGLIGLFQMPYQLSPTVTEPVITVSTTWRGATPYEIEREVIEEQEKTLKGIPGLVEMESDAYNDRGEISLRFTISTDIDDALLRVSNKINEVQSYPEGTDRPVISATGASTSPIIWMVMKTLEGNDRPISTYRTFFENEIRQHLERVSGVADLFVGGGEEAELHIVVKPERLAAFRLTMGDLINAVQTGNQNVSAGTLGVGRRNFRIRTTGEFKSIEDVENLVLKSTGQQRVRLFEVADVKEGFEKRDATVLHNGEGGMAVGIKPVPGTNVLDLTDRVKKVVERLNEERMHPEKIHFKWVYDQRPYIRGAISLIQQNILVGGAFAVTVLLLFLWSVRSTVVVATAIPISVIGSFIFMNAFGRNLNVVSLSGIAFAVGMLVDNAIVVIENIDRHRSMGKSPFNAAYDGAKEVWGAILASTLTTVAVFLPVVFLEEEAGQLFRDIALAVVCAVLISLMVSISVIPMLSRYAFALGKNNTNGRPPKKRRHGLGFVGKPIAGGFLAVVSLAVKNWLTRIITICVLTGVAVAVALFLMPETEYLPQGNRNFILNILIPPPGLSNEERYDIGQYMFGEVEPYMGKETHNGLPGIENMFYVGTDWIMLSGAISTHESRARELLPMFNRIIFSIPGMMGVSLQAGIFQDRLGGGRTIDVDISGSNLEQIAMTAMRMFGRIMGVVPGSQVRPVPSMELLYPEIRFEPDRDRLRANSMSARDLGVAVDVLMDGRIIGEYKEEGEKKVDMVLKTGEQTIETPEALNEALLAMPHGDVVPVSTLATLKRTSGIAQIRHLERNRTITLQVTPPPAVPLQAAMKSIQQQVITPMKNDGQLENLNVALSGAAAKLTETIRALQWNFVLAALISYLLMSALFGNFLYPLCIMFTVPLAGAGGILGLFLLNLFVVQTMDILTMLGFVILIGVVVNNAILIVYQALNHVRYHGMDHKEAVLESVKVRLRPIYMSASTSIFGMLPLVLFPGSGSELYRGLGAVILGGIATSTVFTIFIIPSLLMFFIKMETPRNNSQFAEAEGTS
jgi:HAE1 family hydrophobic/amphiphilic exporter-1